MKGLFKRIGGYVLQGLIFIMPVGVTLFIVFWFVGITDDLIYPWVSELLPFHVPGLGLIVAFAVLAIIGFVVANIISLSAINWFDRLMKKAPLIKVIYTAVYDLISVFFGKSDKLGKPVRVLMQNSPVQYKLGFVTSEDLTEFGFGEDMLSVYMPFSYGLVGNLVIVSRKDVKYLDIPATQVMKFIISGGAVHLNDDN